jgi:nitrogen regulatory protein P-II 1
MKKIEAIIRPAKYEDVKKALEEAGYPGVTVTEVEGHGKQKGIVQQWRGQEYRVELLPKLKLEIVCPSKDAHRIVKAILESASTGAVGDGKVFVSHIEEAFKIRNGESGDKVVA